MAETAPRGERLNIGLFGRRNVGKSSLLNALCGQSVSIVSNTAGTTTDAVAKIYELIPVGPVTFFDTAGIDDIGEVGEKRVQATRRILYKSDIAVIVSDGCFGDFEKALIKTAKDLKIPFVLVFNKADILPESDVSFDFPFIRVSAEKKTNIEELKEILKSLVPDYVKNAPPLLRDLIKKGDTVVCVCPIDASAPKGRLILPQVQAIRDILDAQAFAYTVQNAEDCKNAINNMKTPPALVVTDSQLIRQVKDAVPPSIPLTTFSTLFARYKGDLKKLCDGAEKLKNLKDGDKVLIAEACSHHVQEDDIARVKIPAAVKKACGKNISFDFAAGIDFPADLEKYALVIHCGGCMLSRLDTLRRLNECSARGVPVTNFGIALSAAQGILDRVVEPFITDEK